MSHGVGSCRRRWWAAIAAAQALPAADLPPATTPSEGPPQPRSWAERAYPNLIHYNQVPRGGHFAAWEQPAAFVSELRTAFSQLR